MSDQTTSTSSTSSTNGATREHEYTCTNRRCRSYHVLVHTTLSPRQYRATTGRFYSCATCGAAMIWKGGPK